MASASELPVLIASSQISQRLEAGDSQWQTPIGLMRSAFEHAAEQCEATGDIRAAVRELATIRVATVDYANSARLLRTELGFDEAVDIKVGPNGGHGPQRLVNHYARQIAGGAEGLVVIAGAEIGRSVHKAAKAGAELPLEVNIAPNAEAWPGDQARWASPAEAAVGLRSPVHAYSMMESALRHGSGRSYTEHALFIGEIWAGFSESASANPNAWDRSVYSAPEILTPTIKNRTIASPYTRLLCANDRVDQASAIFMCSLQTAHDLGVPEDAMVFVTHGFDADDTAWLTQRETLTRTRAISLLATALRSEPFASSDFEHLDLYSCFPSIVEITCVALGIEPLSRPLTVTGGLTFAGGPWNNYSGQAIAQMFDVLRATPGRGLLTANGGHATKHSWGVYSTEAPAAYRPSSPQTFEPAVQPATGIRGKLKIESYTVAHDRLNRPPHVLATVMPTPHVRSVVWASHPDVVAYFQQEVDCVGIEVDVADGEIKGVSEK